MGPKGINNFNLNDVLQETNDGFYMVKNIRFSADVPIYFDLWLLLKDLSDEELDELQKITTPGQENELKLDYADKWLQYVSNSSTKTLAVR